MIDLIKWFILLDVLGWVVFPISFQLFKGLADKGLSVSKIIGLLLWGYIYWIGNTFQILKNDLPGVFLAFFVIGAISVLFIQKNSFASILNWCKVNFRIVIFYEILFLGAFFGWAIIRAANPEIIGTEKPMELAFITSIFRSPSFPPNDPWLSNYAISYYYFGYLLVAMMMRLCGTISGVAFNLAISAWFALAAMTSSGILFNLLFFRKEQSAEKNLINRLLLFSLFAPLMILIVSNGEGFLEVLHSKGLFWSMDSNQQMVSSIWKWVDIKELSDPPALPLKWLPGRPGGNWWWRASRVLQDYTLNGQSREIIDEFPFFSFLLADLHPHVLSMPFVLLVIYFGFSRLIQQKTNEIKHSNIINYFKSPQLWLSGFFLGVLLFVNTWDFPIYFGLFVFLQFLQLWQSYGINKTVIKELVFFSFSLVIISIILYFPFLLGLSSQAGGFLPSMVFRTRGIHFLIMFLPQILLISWLLIGNAKSSFSNKKFSIIMLVGILLSLLLLLSSCLYTVLPNILTALIRPIAAITEIDMKAGLSNLQNSAGSLLSIFGADTVDNLIRETLRRFISDPYLALILIAFISLCIMEIPQLKSLDKNISKAKTNDNSIQFILILIVLGALLCLFPEFFYLRDQFGWRMNTIFKFYFQAWILFSLAAAFAIAEISFKIKNNVKKIFTILFIVIILGIGMIYPIFAAIDKTNAFNKIVWTLDGNKYFQLSNPLEYEAIAYLNNAPYGVVAEAVGGSYTSSGRVSKFTGLPTILGWPGHESQWRGGANEIGNRESDIKELYLTSNWYYAKDILDKYKIRYVFLGILEKSTYPVSEEKFQDNLIKVFDNSESTIYEYSPSK